MWDRRVTSSLHGKMLRECTFKSGQWSYLKSPYFQKGPLHCIKLLLGYKTRRNKKKTMGNLKLTQHSKNIVSVCFWVKDTLHYIFPLLANTTITWCVFKERLLRPTVAPPHDSLCRRPCHSWSMYTQWSCPVWHPSRNHAVALWFLEIIAAKEGI